MIIRNTLTALLVLLFATPAISASLTFSAPPLDDRLDWESKYRPFAQALSSILGVEVEADRPVNWGQYSRNVQRGEYDIILDDAHFVSWRLANTQHQPILRFPGNKQYKVVVPSSNRRIKEFSDLGFYRVCAMASPHLTATVVLSQFDPMKSPTIFASLNGGAGIINNLFLGRCEAAVLEQGLYEKGLTETQRSQLKIIYESSAIPNKALTVGPRVNDAHKMELIDALTNPDSQLSAVINGIESGVRSFTVTDSKNYSSYATMLQGVVWGW